MKKFVSWIVMGLLSSVCFATPGELLEGSALEFEEDAAVLQSFVTGDGSVFLLGDFTKVDGVARPGLAKLKPSGELDLSFDPSVRVDLSEVLFDFGTDVIYPSGSPLDLWDQFSFEQTRPLFFRSAQISEVGGGRLMLRNGPAWVILDATGAVMDSALPDFPRDEDPPLVQYIQNPRMLVLAASGEFQMVDLATDRIDESFATQEGWTDLPIQAIPASGGKIWTLSERGDFQVVCRLLEDGSPDESFPPLELREGTSHQLEKTRGSGFAVISFFRNFTSINSAPRYRARWLNEGGSVEATVDFSPSGYGFGGRSIQLEPWQEVIYFNNQFGEYVRKDTAGKVEILEGLLTASPLGSSEDARATGPLNFIPGSSTFNRFTLIGGTRKFSGQLEADPSWHEVRLTRAARRVVALEGPDDTLIIGGDFNRVNGVPCKGMVRVLADGIIDPSFAPELDLRFATMFQVGKDEKIYALFGENFVRDGKEVAAVRMAPSGAVELGYEIAFRPLSQTSFGIILLADGSVILSRYRFGGFAVSSTSYSKYGPDGELDTNWGSGGASGSRGGAIFPLNDGSFLKGITRYSGNGELIEALDVPEGASAIHQDAGGATYFQYGGSNGLVRWTPEGGIDEHFVNTLPGGYFGVRGMTSTARGKFFIWGDFGGGRTVQRYHATGQLDVTFRAPRLFRKNRQEAEFVLGYGGLSAEEKVTELLPTNVIARDGAVLVTGGFDNPQGSFLLLDDSDVAGFAGWSEAILGEVVPEDGDADGDGASNLEEYAAGSDPSFSDAHRWRVRASGEGAFQVPCNPEAPEILRILEVSDDLVNWRTGLANEVSQDTTAGCLRFQLEPEKASLYGRVVYRKVD
jgi:hypothetical protein